MAKQYSKQSETGERGIALIDRLVTNMGFVWHPRRIDHGIDGEIELVDTVSRTPLNRLIQVQSKASSIPFPGEDDESFHFDVSRDDAEYWQHANTPVILVCSHPDTDEAWWALAERAQFSAARTTRRVVFDKRRDRFDGSAAAVMLSLAAHGAETSPSKSISKQERLVSNLLRVESFGDTIWMAPTWLRRPKEAKDILRARHEFCDDWILDDRTLFSFTRPESSPLQHLVDGPAEALEVGEWAESKDADVSRRFVRLLNQTLADVLAPAVRRHKDGYLFFRPSADLEPLRIGGQGTSRGRTVFERYIDKNDAERVLNYRHYALRASFVRLDGSWFAELQPTYHYTFDGYRELPWGPELLKRMKQFEKNDAVRRLVEFWGRYLRPTGSLFAETDRRLVFGDLATFAVDRGIHDPAWKAKPTQETEAPDGSIGGML